MLREANYDTLDSKGFVTPAERSPDVIMGEIKRDQRLEAPIRRDHSTVLRETPYAVKVIETTKDGYPKLQLMTMRTPVIGDMMSGKDAPCDRPCV